jgi:hypothetical protein
VTRFRRRKVRLALAVSFVALAAAGCGSTRFVVVEQGPGRDAATTPSSGSAPSAGGEETSSSHAASKDEKKELAVALDDALGLDQRSFAARQKALEGSDDLGPTFEAVRKVVGTMKVELPIESATVDGDQATLTVSVVLDGTPFATGIPVPMVRRDGTWLVTRSGACAVLALGSPCPDAPPSS